MAGDGARSRSCPRRVRWPWVGIRDWQPCNIQRMKH